MELSEVSASHRPVRELRGIWQKPVSDNQIYQDLASSSTAQAVDSQTTAEFRGLRSALVCQSSQLVVLLVLMALNAS